MSNEQKQTLVTTVSQAKIASVSGLEELLAIAEAQTINLIPKTVTFGTRLDLILTTHLIFVNTTLRDLSFTNKQGKVINYKEKSNGDIYLVDSKSKKYALSNRKLKEIADAAGIISIDLNRIGDIEYDVNGRINYVKYKLIWERLDIDGTTKRGITEGFYSYQAQVDKKKKDDDESYDLSFLEKQRGDGEKLAIANAYSRAIRDAIPQMPATFTLEELQKPLLVPSVTKDLSKLIEQFPNIQEALLAKELGVADLIYGSQKRDTIQKEIISQHQTEPIVSSQKPGNVEDAKIIQPDKKKEVPEQPQTQAPPAAETTKATASVPGPTPQELNKITAKEYQNQPEDVRVKKIEDLLKQKGKSWTGKQAIGKYTAVQHVKFIEDLLNLPDVIEEEIHLK